MKALTEEFVTDLSVTQCAEAFRVGARASFGGMRKLQAFTASMADRPKAEFRFFTPEKDPVFGELDEDPPTWTAAAAVPGLNKLAGMVEMVVHIYVWDRESHREVVLYAPYATGDKGSTQRVLRRIIQEFPPLSVPEPAKPQLESEGPSARHEVVVHLESGALVFNTGPSVAASGRVPADLPDRPVDESQANPHEVSSLSIPAPSSPRERRDSRWPVYALIAVVVAAVGIGIAWIAGNGSGDETELAQSSDSDVVSGQEGDTSVGEDGTAVVSSGPVSLQEPGAAGVWTGEAFYPDAPPRQRNYEVTMRLEAQGDGLVDGQVRYRNSSTGVVGAWQVEGQDLDGQISVSAADWIGRPSPSWSRENLELTQNADGSLTGSATNEYDASASGTVELDLVGQAPVDSDSVGQDWRVALVAPESDAINMLDEMRQQDLAVRDSLDGYWVPQVSSGCQGLKTSLGPLMASSILATHANAMQDYGAITVTWEDVGTEPPEACPNDTMWVALVPETFSKAAGAKRWCTSNGYTGGSCAARYLVPRGQRGTDIEYLD